MTLSQTSFLQQDVPELEDQLHQALLAPQIPPELAERGQRLLQRLTSPVQIMVLGPAGSGKSSVVDMLLGQQVAGGDAGTAEAGLAMVELVYGATPEVQFDGGGTPGERLPGQLSDYDVPAHIVSARQFLPHPMLTGQSITEITLAGSVAQQQAILRHAADYADIILWCSQSFGDTEQALWAQVPERKQDNGLLVLTMADQQIMRGALQDTVAELAAVVNQRFMGLYPVAALQGLKARQGRKRDDQDLWRASGAQRLAEDLRRRVAQGRAATQDQVETLLWQISAVVSASPVAKPRSVPDVAAAPEVPLVPASVKQADAGGQAVLQSALSRLQSHATDMLNEAGDSPQSAVVLDQCLVAVRDMAETLLATPADGPQIQAAREAGQDGEEMLMLLQLEQDEDAAVDAVTLLLQLKKELTDPALASVAAAGPMTDRSPA